MQIYDDLDEVYKESSRSHKDDSLNAVVWATRDSVAGRVESFVDIITEWFLFDSSYKKDIKSFLMSENIDDIFTESEFIDLICSNAYLKENLVQLISLKLPFKITLKRLLFLNNETQKTHPNAHLITKSNVDDKIKEQIQIKSQKEKAARHKYYLKNREYIIAKQRQYYEEHKEEIKAKHNANKEYRRAMYQKHKEKIIKDNLQYYFDNKEAILAQRKKSYQENPEKYQTRRKKYYEKNKEEVLKRKKQYVKEHYDEIKQKRKKYYEENKEEIKAKSSFKAKKNRQLAKKALEVCVVYLFLRSLRRRKKEQYLKMYKKHQNPVLAMMKTCVALQNMDFNLCPLINNINDYKQCGCPKAFRIPGAIDEIQKHIQTLKQKNNQR